MKKNRVLPLIVAAILLLAAACAPTLHDPEEFAGPPPLLATEGVEARVHTDFAPQQPPPPAPTTVWLDSGCLNPEALELKIICLFYGNGQQESITGTLIGVTYDAGSCSGYATDLTTGSGKLVDGMVLTSIKRQYDTTDFQAYGEFSGQEGKLFFPKCIITNR